jgi:hypothetical protein
MNNKQNYHLLDIEVADQLLRSSIGKCDGWTQEELFYEFILPEILAGEL